MENITDLFAAPSADLDTQLSAAADVLQKLAADEGLDLNDLPEEDVAGLLSEIMGGAKTAAAAPAPTTSTPETTKEAMTTPAITYAQVAQELTKRAAAEGIDLTGMSGADYQLCFDKVAEDLTDPDYAEKVAAAEAEAAAEELEKKAAHEHMYELGATAARGFIDTLSKEAADDEPEEKKEKGDKGDAPAKPNPFAKGGDKGDKGDDEKKEEKKEASAAIRSRLVAAFAKTASAAPAVDEIEVEATKLAQDFLRNNGIDPATGEKLAAPTREEQIEARAIEILKQAGYQV